MSIKQQKEKGKIISKNIRLLSKFGALHCTTTRFIHIRTTATSTVHSLPWKHSPFFSSVVVELVNPRELLFAVDVSGAPGSRVVPLGGASRSTASVMENSVNPDKVQTETMVCGSRHARLHLMIFWDRASIAEYTAKLCRFH